MMTRVLLATNVVPDVLLNRDPWQADASAIWRAVDSGTLTAYVTASSVTDIFYVARRLTDIARARRAVQVCLGAFNIGAVDRGVLERARALRGSDFEANVQIACAELNGLDAIVTRNSADFEGSPLPVWSPAECLKNLRAGRRSRRA